MAAVAVLAASLGAMALAGDLRERPGRFLLLQGVAFAAYAAGLVAARRLPGGRGGFLAVLVVGAALRGLLLPAEPTLSDDLYRYVWDGRVAAAGINPYRLAPDHPDRACLRGPDWEKINHKEIPTIYPPLMQGIFLAAAVALPSALGLKAVILVFDLGLILILGRLVRLGGGAPWRLAVYAWNPLVIIEVAGSGHNDVVAVTFLVGALLAIIQGRSVLSTAALAASILAKLVPLVTLPTFLRRTRTPALWPLLLLAAGYLPFLGAGGGLFRGLAEYGQRWQHNDFLFRGLLQALLWLDPSEPLKHGVTWLRSVAGSDLLNLLYPYTHPQYLARGVAYCLMAVAGVYVSFKPWGPSRELLVCLTAVLLLAPAVHPWYLLWIAPLLALHPSRALILWTGLAPLSYAFTPGAGHDPPGGPLLFAEYVPVLLLLAWEVRRRRSPGRRGDGVASTVRADAG